MNADERALLQEVGHRVARRRLDRGWSQATLARTAGLPVSALGVIERGERPADLLRLAALARALRVPLGELLRDLSWPSGRPPERPGSAR